MNSKDDLTVSSGCFCQGNGCFFCSQIFCKDRQAEFSTFFEVMLMAKNKDKISPILNNIFAVPVASPSGDKKGELPEKWCGKLQQQ